MKIKAFAVNLVKFLPGIILVLAIAAVAKLIESVLPIHLIGASIIALFIGIIINTIKKPHKIFDKGLKFTSKKLLKLAIILLGASLSIGTILTVGKLSLVVMAFTLLTCFGGGFLCGKLLKLDWKLSNMISAGTGICGGSAIAAIAPAIEAQDKDIAYAMSATFLFDMVMILLFPLMGKWMGLSDMAYGLWAGTAVNDTSSVVAAGYAFSEAAGDFATMVKLTRTLSIIPTVIIFSIINLRLKKKQTLRPIDLTTTSLNIVDTSTVANNMDSVANASNTNCLEVENNMDSAINTANTKKKKLNFMSLFPWFILGFVALAIINSFGLIDTSLSNALKEISKFLMVAALAAIGLNTSLKEMKSAGFRPMLHGFIISALVVVVALVVELCMGII